MTDEERRKERLRQLQILAGRTPGQTLTKEQFEELGYGLDGAQPRALTDDPIGTKPRPKGHINEETNRG